MAREQTHTPGPWRFEPHNCFGRKDPDGYPFPFGYVSGERPGSPIFELSPILSFSREELAANARLIAAAPDMLAALKGFNVTEGMVVGGTATTLTLQVPITVIQAAAAAVAKVEAA